MKKLIDKFLRFWYFKVVNRVVARGEKGGFKWCFRRYSMELRTVSGNWKMTFVANDHPYAYLLESLNQGNEENVHGYAAMLYGLGCLLTREQRLVDDVQKAMRKYDERMIKAESKKPREDDEIALKEVEMEEEYIEQMRTQKRKRNEKKGAKEAGK